MATRRFRAIIGSAAALAVAAALALAAPVGPASAVTRSLSGTVQVPASGGGFPVGYGDASARVYLVDPDTQSASLVADIPTAPNGDFVVSGLAEGTYVVKAVDLSSGSTYVDQYWHDAGSMREAARLRLSGSTVSISGMYITLQRDITHISRLSGADRFAAAVSMSVDSFGPGVPVAYVVNGTTFPDALSAGPAAALLGGPVLPVLQASIPPVVLAELQRLQPAKIVVVGGPNSISPQVTFQLGQLTEAIDTIVGADRFAVSISLARRAFVSHPSDIFLANGGGFADALSAGAAAASKKAPVVLVNGAASSVDPELQGLLGELQTTHIWVAGGPNSVGAPLVHALETLGYQVDRIGVADRYAVSAAIGAQFFTENDTVYLAVGSNFPDALAGTALAGHNRAPLFITPTSCLPPAIGQLLRVLDVSQLTLLGGPNSLAPALEHAPLPSC